MSTLIKLTEVPKLILDDVLFVWFAIKLEKRNPVLGKVFNLTYEIIFDSSEKHSFNKWQALFYDYKGDDDFMRNKKSECELKLISGQRIVKKGWSFVFGTFPSEMNDFLYSANFCDRDNEKIEIFKLKVLEKVSEWKHNNRGFISSKNLGLV